MVLNWFLVSTFLHKYLRGIKDKEIDVCRFYFFLKRHYKYYIFDTYNIIRYFWDILYSAMSIETISKL